MEGVWIMKNGLRATQWDGDLREYVERPIRHVFRELRGACQIENDVTLRDIIEMVGRHDELSFLISHYAWCDVRAFVEEVRRPATKSSGLKYIEISAAWEIEEIFEKEPKPDMHLNIDVHGRDDSEQRYAIELTPVNELADLPVRLDPVIHVDDWRDWKSRPNQEITVDCGQYTFCLLDVFGEIFNEISFHGSPAQRDIFGMDLKEIADEAKAAIESGDTSRLIPWEPPKETIQ